MLEVGPELAKKDKDFKAANFSNTIQDKLGELHFKKEIIEEEIKMALTKYKKGNLDGKELRAEAEKEFAKEEKEKEDKAFLKEVDEMIADNSEDITKADCDGDCKVEKEDNEDNKVDRRISALEKSMASVAKGMKRWFNKKEEKEEKSENYLAGIEKFMAPMLEKIMTPITQGLAAMIETQKQMSVTLAGMASNMQNNSQMNNSLFQGLVLGSMLGGGYRPQEATFNPYNTDAEHIYFGGNNFFRRNRPAVGFNFGTVNQWGGNGTVNQS